MFVNLSCRVLAALSECKPAPLFTMTRPTATVIHAARGLLGSLTESCRRGTAGLAAPGRSLSDRPGARAGRRSVALGMAGVNSIIDREQPMKRKHPFAAYVALSPTWLASLGTSPMPEIQ